MTVTVLAPSLDRLIHEPRFIKLVPVGLAEKFICGVKVPALAVTRMPSNEIMV